MTTAGPSFYADLLADNAETLGEPIRDTWAARYASCGSTWPASGCGSPNWLAPGRRGVLLTVFHKTQRAESAEVQRALQAQQACEAGHGHAED